MRRNRGKCQTIGASVADKERQLEFDRHQTQLLAELRAPLRELERMVGHPSDSHGGFVLAVAA